MARRRLAARRRPHRRDDEWRLGGSPHGKAPRTGGAADREGDGVRDRRSAGGGCGARTGHHRDPLPTPPSFTAPDLTAAPDLSAAPHLLRGAVPVALAQAAGITPSLPDPDGTRSDINGDFRSQGYANLADGLFQALPSGGSTSRTGVAVSAGARTR
ncbi:SulP family inorganic anion transporter [Streptomyces hydrogenans]|uniref:SulP family inorganic anion transporter n=1 Tax=Streptomyces hydrogenans TaxID=1873719 RepID=UPI00278BF87D|nr:SulP family inorganic anion transporter [Streptomyces hydrogenans]